MTPEEGGEWSWRGKEGKDVLSLQELRILEENRLCDGEPPLQTNLRSKHQEYGLLTSTEPEALLSNYDSHVTQANIGLFIHSC